jgi:hypothetical protein
MTKERRTARLESSGGAKIVLLRWLEEAHRDATLVHHTVRLLDRPTATWPVDLLGGRVAAQVRRTMRGAKDWEIEWAIRGAVAEAAFLLSLVMLLNADADQQEREDALRAECLSAQFQVLDMEHVMAGLGEGLGIDTRPPVAQRLGACQAAFSTLLREMERAEVARHLLEERYLDGHPTLFPGTAEAWQETRDMAVGLASIVAEVTGPAATADDADSDHAAAMALASDLADRARSAALGMLGDAVGSRAVTARRLQAARSVRTQPRTEVGESHPGQDAAKEAYQ